MYRAQSINGIYRICKDELELKTPAGRELICESKELAELLAEHLNRFGEGHEDPRSIAAFHYPWLDFGQIISRDKLELSLAILINPKDDWTLHNPFTAQETRKRWEALFLEPGQQIRMGRKWLSRLSVPQLLAVSLVQRGYGSINIPYIVHSLPEDKVVDFADKMRDHLPNQKRPALAEIIAVLQNFRFYYRLDENGGRG